MLAAPVIPIFSLFIKLDLEGEEHLPEEGAFVLAPNHYSELDPLAVAIAVYHLGRAPRFLAKESLFRNKAIGWAFRSTGMVPVARSSSSRAAKQTIEAAERLATNGQGIIVYPEGSLTRDPDMWPMRGKTGAVRLALAGDIPLIPMAHWGVQAVLPRYGKKPSLWPLRKRVRLVIGPEVDLSAYRGVPATPEVLANATDAVMHDIADLLGGLRGQTPPAERWNPAAHGQAETGRL
ncbi:lysophospholipid acyltransferase family protein [Microbacterium sp. X-17]|uniref:lysophospholipid acyltransferase family protein n=1 Tax=Microbacterium sp. X-17 TaxID=3144404 RepID=UPI0031F5847F